MAEYAFAFFGVKEDINNFLWILDSYLLLRRLYGFIYKSTCCIDIIFGTVWTLEKYFEKILTGYNRLIYRRVASFCEQNDEYSPFLKAI